MAEAEPQYASDYDDCTTVAVKSELVEIGQVLGSYKGKFAVIGGAVSRRATTGGASPPIRRLVRYPSDVLLESSDFTRACASVRFFNNSQSILAVNWRRVGLVTTSGSSACLACAASGPGGVVASLLDPPQGRSTRSH